MHLPLLALGAGLAALRLLPSLPSTALTLSLVLAGALLGWRWRALGLFCLGLAWSVFSAQAALDGRLAEALDGRTFWLEGRVEGLPEADGEATRFQLVDIASGKHVLPARLRLSWYRAPPLKAGERWRVAARLKRPHGLVNPGTFDYEAWLLARRIGAAGTVKAGERVAEAGAGGWRDALRERLLHVEAVGRQGAIAALVVGDDSGLNETDWAVLRDTGTVHLMVISGQHISLLAGLLFAAVWALARRGWWPRALPWLPAASFVALAGACGYGLLAGFDVPVQRACVMVAMVLLWRCLFFHLGAWLPLLVAFDLVLLVEPLASLQPGFWLSFGAVALLVLAFAGRLGAWPRGWVLPRAQWAMTVGLLPLLLALGLPVSLSAPLANLVAVPLVGLAVVPLALLGTLTLPLPFIGEGLLWLAGGLLEGLFVFLAQLAKWQPAWTPALLPGWALVMGGLGATILLLPAGVPLRALGLALLLPMVFPSVSSPAHGRAQVQVLDVGQGLAVLVRTRHHTLLYDAGPRQGRFDLGERVVVPSLRALGAGRLDVLVLSHADQDHAGGASAVLRSLHPQQLVRPDGAGFEVGEPCRSGARWQWDGVEFALWQMENPPNDNAGACVLRIEASGERLLLTGDMDLEAERALLAQRWPVAAEWLLLAHHGSRTSSGEAFLRAVGARHGLISRSRGNPFGHPHTQVVARAERLGMRLHDTSEEGALSFELGAFGAPHGAREAPTFWRRN